MCPLAADRLGPLAETICLYCTCGCLQTVVCLSVVDLLLGGFFLFTGLWILLDWKVDELYVWLPFVVIGGLLSFTTFLRCGCLSAAEPQLSRWPLT